MKTKQEICDETVRLARERAKAIQQATKAPTAYGVLKGWRKAAELAAKIAALKWVLGEAPDA